MRRRHCQEVTLAVINVSNFIKINLGNLIKGIKFVDRYLKYDF